MNPYKFPLALLAFMGFVLVMPGWQFFLRTRTPEMTVEAAFLISLVLPILVALFIASWLQPGGGV